MIKPAGLEIKKSEPLETIGNSIIHENTKRVNGQINRIIVSDLYNKNNFMYDEPSFTRPKRTRVETLG